MNWLDLGWLKRGNEWEFHPWGPFTRGYLLTESDANAVRAKVRWIRGVVGAVGLFVLVASYLLRQWWPLVVVALVGGGVEGLLTWLVVRRLSRTESSMGWGKGMLYLAKWSGPKLLTLARMAAWVLVVMGLLIVWREPTRWTSYLLVGAFVAVQFLLNYLEQVQRLRR